MIGLPRLHALLLAAALAFSEALTPPARAQGGMTADSIYWRLDGPHAVVWPVAASGGLPHADHLEMSGRTLSAVVTYAVGADRRLSVSREVIWPMLRTLVPPGAPPGSEYRAYLRRTYPDDRLLLLSVDGAPLRPGLVDSVRIDGTLTFVHAPSGGLHVRRTLFPSPQREVFVETWTITNGSRAPVVVEARPARQGETLEGHYGTYRIEVSSDSLPPTRLAPGERRTLAVYFTARRAASPPHPLDAAAALAGRRAFLAAVRSSLRLETPDAVLNTAFAFAKIRTSESLFETKVGLVHSPGGGRYYGGVWANDQAEYAGPFFPFLGYDPANAALLNAYRIFARHMRADYTRIWPSFEMEGDHVCCSKDRGDAAMIAYGAARYALARGDRDVAAELWPAVAWGLEYTRRKTTPRGVIASDSDEMEGRLPTGDANLATSSLAYGALRAGADLARALGQADSARAYDERAAALAAAIEATFGADLGGFHTYRYFDGHETLRHWITLPLAMGIATRAEGTMRALYTHLWTDRRGLQVEPGSGLYWDRGTLYALRAGFIAGFADTTLAYLRRYTEQRLLGPHVPYAVEAWPEGNEAHLAAESALYARVFTEGLFGITPVGLRSFEWRPRLPAAWPRMALRDVRAFGDRFDLEVERADGRLALRVLRGGEAVFTDHIRPGGSVTITLPE